MIDKKQRGSHLYYISFNSQMSSFKKSLRFSLKTSLCWLFKGNVCHLYLMVFSIKEGIWKVHKTVLITIQHSLMLCSTYKETLPHILLLTTLLCLNIFENITAFILLDFASLNFSDSVDKWLNIYYTTVKIRIVSRSKSIA